MFDKCNIILILLQGVIKESNVKKWRLNLKIGDTFTNKPIGTHVSTINCATHQNYKVKSTNNNNNNNNNNNHGSTALYGLWPPLSQVTGSCAFVAVSDRLTGRAFQLDPEPSGSQETWVRNGL
jgi:hypothetical protein